MIKKPRGQSLVEALFVVVFTAIIMFAFLQICIIAVDDMTANEAAFTAMRSAAVTGGGEAKFNEAKNRVKKYLVNFYPFTVSETTSRMLGSFGFSNSSTVGTFFNRKNESEDNNEEESVSSDDSDSFVTMHKPVTASRKTYDYSNNVLTDHTVKIYYFTRVMFGSLVAKKTSRREMTDKILGKSGSRRYQSARSRMVPSPDSAYYNKAYPGARNFEDEE